MADTVTTQTIQDGERTAVLRFTNVSDGSGESAVKKVDVSALAKNSAGKECTEVHIQRIYWATVGMSVNLEFDASSNVLAIGLPANSTCSRIHGSYSASGLQLPVRAPELARQGAAVTRRDWRGAIGPLRMAARHSSRRRLFSPMAPRPAKLWRDARAQGLARA